MTKNIPIVYFLLLVTLAAFWMTSCKRQQEAPERPEYFIPLLDEAWRLADSGIWFESEVGRGTVFYVELPIESDSK